MKILKSLNVFTVSLLFSTLVSLPAYAEQTCDADIKSTAPDSRFKDIGNGEIEDLQTGLVWQRCSIGQSWNGTSCTGEAKNLTWLEALQSAKALGSGYRLPNLKEAYSIVENKCKKPALNTKFFSIEGTGDYWTSTPNTDNGNQAFAVSFYFGTISRLIPNYLNKETLGDGPAHAMAVRTK